MFTGSEGLSILTSRMMGRQTNLKVNAMAYEVCKLHAKDRRLGTHSSIYGEGVGMTRISVREYKCLSVG